ncbi:MAG: pyruvate kinase alpha/beta domain-containing protein [bacterium]
METGVFYWEKPGYKNTQKTLDLAVKRAKKLKIKNIVIASCSGITAKKLLKQSKSINIVSITHQAGFHSPGKCELAKKTKTFLEKRGVKVYTGTHFFGGVGRAIRLKFGGLEADELIANTLRIFGQGVKVTIEIAIMALDAGLIPYDKEIIAIGGAGKGADTAIVCIPGYGKDFFSFEVREIICKPRHKK